MTTIMEAFYRGQIVPDESIVPSQPEYRAINRQVSTQAQQWRERLGEDTFLELEEFLYLRDRADRMHVEAAFHHGFKLGANLLIEVMGNHTYGEDKHANPTGH